MISILCTYLHDFSNSTPQKKWPLTHAGRREDSIYIKIRLSPVCIPEYNLSDHHCWSSLLVIIYSVASPLRKVQPHHNFTTTSTTSTSTTFTTTTTTTITTTI